ncbi:hypothetical protein TSOC_009876 [Tetrabaena socialis]|uniref:Uncharacterized protein n=1 Tax=Tetrabaena socialis TaxID=47790 RepID=A0A2J7ZUV2_9CHLO|nr:hypothetical protein TSOC_009876 [Tetrabaena socialis]|eukprot:PNH04020.1 hypothetical protein TSOC_009876 [Tetrabaena socialis]
MCFRGIIYNFTDSSATELHRMTNNTARGVSLLLHPDEPSPPAGVSSNVLRHMPLGIVVRPDGPALGAVYDLPAGAPNPIPPDCIVILPETHTFTPPHPLGTPAHKAASRGFPLGDDYAVSDYAAQGQSFRATSWLAHLNPPAAGVFTHASLYVILTRIPDWESLHLLAPLWNPRNESQHGSILDKFRVLAKPEPELAAELPACKAWRASQRPPSPPCSLPTRRRRWRDAEGIGQKHGVDWDRARAEA